MGLFGSRRRMFDTSGLHGGGNPTVAEVLAAEREAQAVRDCIANNAHTMEPQDLRLNAAKLEDLEV